MAFKSAVFVGTSIVIGILAACDSGGGGGVGGGSATDVSSFAQQYCEIFAPCCAKANRPTDGTICRGFVTAAGADKTYDPAAGSACISETRANAQKPDFCEKMGEAPSCKRVFSAAGGGAQPGQPCSDDSECATSPEGETECVSSYESGGATTRVCQIHVRGKEGDAPCVGTRDGSFTSYSGSYSVGAEPAPPPAKGFICDTSENLYCDELTKACKRMQDVGGPCELGGMYACVKTAYCDYREKKCVARLGVGGDCSTGLSQACQEGLYCDPTERVCKQGLAEGAPCQRSDECSSRSCVNGKCEGSISGGNSLALAFLCGGN